MSRWRALGDRGAQGPRRLGTSLDRHARRLGAPGAAPLAAVFVHWERVVGPAVAAHARPASLAGGVLTVVVDDPVWATQLRYLGPDVLRGLAAAAGGEVATRLEVRVRR